MRAQSREAIQDCGTYLLLGYLPVEVTFSRAINWRLLDTYAPDHRPSTKTLALKTEGVEREFANGSALPTVPVAMPGSAPAQQSGIGDLSRRAVEDGRARQLLSVSEALREHRKMAQNHIANLRSRLADADRAVACAVRQRR